MKLGGSALAGTALLGSGALAGGGGESGSGATKFTFSFGADNLGSLQRIADRFNQQFRG